jgi:outer membrane protein assembly factor BamB
MRLHMSVLAILIIALNSGLAAEPIADSDLRTVRDLLRGYSDAELQAARVAVPARVEPPLPDPTPRKVSVRGFVFEDENGNGRRDAGEPGMPEVSVSDGQHVKSTDSDGSYRFEFAITTDRHHRFVAATRPNGFRPTTSFFGRIPFDEGSKEYEFDFGFVRDAVSGKPDFWFMAASDSQFTTIEQMIPTAKDYAQLTSAPGNPAFLTTAGDLTMNGSQFEWDMYDYIRKSAKIPVYEGFGGHDGNFLKPRSTANFEERIGPPYYSWTYGGVHFIQLITETGYLPTAAQRRQYAWLQADLESLKPGTPVIAISHYPLEADWFDRRRKQGINVICQIGAHWHAVQAGSRHGVPVLISAPARGKDWGAFSRTYRWVHVSPQGVTSQLRVAGQYERLEIVAPASQTTTGKQPFVVLAYDTANVVASVTCRWTAPSRKRTETKLEAQGDWSWHGEFEPNEAGVWTAELSAKANGRTWRRTAKVEVAPGSRPSAKPRGDFKWMLDGELAPRRLRQGPKTPLSPLWVRNTGSIHTLHNTPAVVDGRIYVPVGNPNAGSSGAGILCLDAGTGERVWFASSPKGDMRAPVTVHDDIVYAISAEGWVGAWHAADGKRIWAKPLKPDYEHGRPLAINNTPPVPTRHGLIGADWRSSQHLLDFQSGETLSEIKADVGYYASFANASGDVLFAARRGRAEANRLPGGESIWQEPETSRSTSAPIVVDGKLIYSGSSGIRVREAETGKIIWQAGHGNNGYQNAIPVVWDNLLIANGEHLRALDMSTGKEVWRVLCAQDVERFKRSRRQTMAGSSSPVIAGDLAWFGHDDGSLRAVEKDGKVAWEYRVGVPIKTSPVVTGNLILVHDFAGNLWCFAGEAK